MRMYRDPDTGLVGAPPPGAVTGESAARAEQALRSAAAPAPPALAEEPVAGPAGGFKVNLRGRFRAEVMRRADAADRTGHECVQPADTAE
jgi:hypothetical protein